MHNVSSSTSICLHRAHLWKAPLYHSRSNSFCSHRRAHRCSAEYQTRAGPSMDPSGPSTAFVPGQEGASRQQIFDRIAPVYDQGLYLALRVLQLNDLLSLGLHRVWKRAAVKWSGAAPGHAALDVCCGSGDLAFRLAAAVGEEGRVVGLDFAPEMLADAERRRREAVRGQPTARIQWVQGDAMALPFEDATFDAATIGYGLRNVADVGKALSELARVLRPGARLAVLDFNNSEQLLVDGLQVWALENVVVPVARMYGMEEEYQYLRPSIKRFPTGPEQEALARVAGFKEAVHYELAGGLMGCLVATVPAATQR